METVITTLIVLATIAGVFLAMFIIATVVCVIYEMRSMKSPGRLRCPSSADPFLSAGPNQPEADRASATIH
jgi:hypothetical protein